MAPVLNIPEPESGEKISLGLEVKRAEAQYSSGYSYRRTITIQESQVTGGSNLTNFPVLMSFTEPELKTTGNGGKVTDGEGDDIIFASDVDGNTVLDFERERYTPTTGEITAWVEIPTLDFDNNTTVYMFYGNSSVTTSQEDVAGTWDADYVGVWHMDDSGATNSDSAGTANDGSVSGATAGAAGKFGPAYSFDGTNDVSTVTDHADLDLTNTGTFEAWMQTTSTSSKPTTNISSWVTRTAPGGISADNYSQMDSVIVGERIYYGNVNCSGANDYFKTASSTLNQATVTAWATSTSPTGACAAGEGSSIGVDSDGEYIWYAVLNNDASTANFSYATATPAGVFSTWKAPGNPSGVGGDESSSIDVVVSGNQVYFYALFQNGTAETDSLARINRDGSGWSGWVDPSGTIPAGTASEGCGVGLETNGNKLYIGGMCGTTTNYGRMNMPFTSITTSDWTNDADPTAAGSTDHGFSDIAVIGDYMYHAAFTFSGATESYSYASSTLNLTTPALVWLNLGADQPNCTAATNSGDAALESDGKNLFYSAFCHNGTTPVWTTASSSLPARPLISKYNAYEMIQVGSGFVFDWVGKPTNFATSTPPDTFKHVTVAHSGSVMSYYVDGIPVASSTVTTDFESNANNLLIGGGNRSDGTAIYFGGIIDEVRVSNTARSADWILTGYNNQNSTSTFYTISEEEEPAVMPTVTTNFATPGFNSATLHGVMTAGNSATQHGFAYSLDSALSSGVSTTSLGTLDGNHAFSNQIIGLSPNQTYYFRAYATNGAGTGFGTIKSFVTGNSTATRNMRLFGKLRVISGKAILYQQ